MSDQLIAAEQEERRRLALFLHDGPVQSLSGIALMLDAVAAAIEGGRDEDASEILEQASSASATRSARCATSRSTSSRSSCATRASGRRCRRSPSSSALAASSRSPRRRRRGRAGERAQVTLYQIIREALHNAIRRKPPTDRGRHRRGRRRGVETVIADNGAGERRRRVFDSLAERARTLSAS